MFRVLLYITIAFAAFYYFIPRAEKNYIMLVKHGYNTFNVLNELDHNNIIVNTQFSRHLARFLDRIYGCKIKCGEYVIHKDMNIVHLLYNMCYGVVMQRYITIPEGYSGFKVSEIINENKYLTGSLIDNIPEGTILPETYAIMFGETRKGLLLRMTKAMNEFIAEQWEIRDPNIPIRDIHEAIILASIIEKEVSVPYERAHVASVFMNRIRRKMRLESCATVEYGITYGRYNLGRALRLHEMHSPKNKYSTYTKQGLPPTPITNPGKESIIATLHPMLSDDIFFVRDINTTNTHIFSKNANEHFAHAKLYANRSNKKMIS